MENDGVTLTLTLIQAARVIGILDPASIRAMRYRWGGARRQEVE